MVMTETEMVRITPQEKVILELLAKGMAEKEIAAENHVSVKTISNQKAAIFRKLGAASSAQAVAFAICRGIINNEIFKEVK